MTLAKPSFEDLLYVASHMRADDKMEVFATRWNDDPAALAADAMNPVLTPFAWIASKENPIAAIGAYPAWPGVWNIWMFATDEFPKISLSLSKFVKRRFMPRLKEVGHRGQCYSHEDHHNAHRWLEAMGGEREGTLKAFGKDGKDFHIYAWQGHNLSPTI